MLPTYCEAENIESLIREIQELKLDLIIFVIDDSSPDGTTHLVKKLQKEYNNVFLLVRPEKLGLGTAITAGFRSLMSFKNQIDYIIAMDADYSHNPRDIPKLIANAKKGYDLVIGSRYYRGGKIIGSHVRRRLISRLANFVASATVGMKIRDCTSGFRCYSKDYVKAALPSLHSETYEIQIETLRQARQRGFHVKEVPITFVNRKRGKSKLQFRDMVGFVRAILKI